MLSAGARPGSMIFDGQVLSDDQYQGTAYLFNSRCGQLPYLVSGPILDNSRRVELRGSAPRVDSNCQIVGYVDDLLTFQLIEPAVASSTNVSIEPKQIPPTINSDASRNATEAQRAEAAKRSAEQAEQRRLAEAEAAKRSAEQAEQRRLAEAEAAKRSAEQAEQRRLAEAEATERAAAEAQKALENEQRRKIFIRISAVVFGALLISIWTFLMLRSKRNKKFASNLTTSRES
jgi:hypothetical protein